MNSLETIYSMIRLKSAFLSVICAFSFFLSGQAIGAVSLSFSDGNSEVSIAPGGVFQFSVYLTVTNPSEVIGFDYYLLGSGVSYEGDFAIVSRASNLALFSELNTSDSAVASPFVDAILSPMNARSLGAFVPDLGSPVAVPGEYLLATFEIGVSAFAPLGSYSINSASASWIDQDISEHAFDGSGNFVVNVVPEPASAGLVIFGLIAFCQRRRKGKLRAG